MGAWALGLLWAALELVGLVSVYEQFTHFSCAVVLSALSALCASLSTFTFFLQDGGGVDRVLVDCSDSSHTAFMIRSADIDVLAAADTSLQPVRQRLPFPLTLPADAEPVQKTTPEASKKEGKAEEDTAMTDAAEVVEDDEKDKKDDDDDQKVNKDGEDDEEKAKNDDEDDDAEKDKKDDADDDEEVAKAPLRIPLLGKLATSEPKTGYLLTRLKPSSSAEGLSEVPVYVVGAPTSDGPACLAWKIPVAPSCFAIAKARDALSKVGSDNKKFPGLQKQLEDANAMPPPTLEIVWQPLTIILPPQSQLPSARVQCELQLRVPVLVLNMDAARAQTTADGYVPLTRPLVHVKVATGTLDVVGPPAVVSCGSACCLRCLRQSCVSTADSLTLWESVRSPR